MSQQMQFEFIQGKLWIHLNGKIFVEDMDQPNLKRASVTKNTQENQIVSPMPGKITKILVQENGRIEKGNSVVIMEAMKMEYNLKANVSGVIDKINCQLGDQVPLGKILVEIKNV